MAPEPSSALTIALIGVAGVLVGALVSFLSQLVQTHMARSHAKKELLRQKYEAFYEQLLLSAEEILAITEHRNPKEPGRTALMPSTRRLAVYSNVYFPELKKAATAYQTLAGSLYLKLLVHQPDFDGKHTLGTLMIRKNSDAYFQLMMEVRNSRDELSKLYFDNADKYALK